MSGRTRGDDEASFRLLDALMGLLLLPVLIGYAGLVLHLQWGWFLTPAFRLRAPSVALCAGLVLLAQLLTSHRAARPRKDDWLTELELSCFVRLSAWLGLGYLIHLWA